MKDDKIQKPFVQKPIRTYESDMAEALGKGASVASIVIAENKRKDEKMMSEEEKKKKEMEDMERIGNEAKDNLQKEIENISTGDVKPIPPPPIEKPVLPITPVPDMVRSSPIVDVAPNVERSEMTGEPITIPTPPTPVLPPKPDEPPRPPQPAPPPKPPEPQPIPKPAPPPPPPKPMPPSPRPIPPPVQPPPPILEPKFKIEKELEPEPEEETEPRVKRNIIKPLITITLIIVFLGGGIYGIYYLYKNSPISQSRPIIEQQITLPSIIGQDKQIILNIDSINKNKLIQEIYSVFNKNILISGKILEIIIKQNVDNDGMVEESLVSGSIFLNKLDIGIPDVLIRSLTDRYMLGTYTEENGQNTPFIILTTDFFQSTFASMLYWEKNMPNDLSDLLDYGERGVGGEFTDRQILNRDVREFRLPNGELLFLYSFINKNSLIITRTESMLIESIKRIEKQIYIR